MYPISNIFHYPYKRTYNNKKNLDDGEQMDIIYICKSPRPMKMDVLSLYMVEEKTAVDSSSILTMYQSLRDVQNVINNGGFLDFNQQDFKIEGKNSVKIDLQRFNKVYKVLQYLVPLEMNVIIIPWLINNYQSFTEPDESLVKKITTLMNGPVMINKIEQKIMSIAMRQIQKMPVFIEWFEQNNKMIDIWYSYAQTRLETMEENILFKQTAHIYMDVKNMIQNIKTENKKRISKNQIVRNTLQYGYDKVWENNEIEDPIERLANNYARFNNMNYYYLDLLSDMCVLVLNEPMCLTEKGASNYDEYKEKLKVLNKQILVSRSQELSTEKLESEKKEINGLLQEEWVYTIAMDIPTTIKYHQKKKFSQIYLLEKDFTDNHGLYTFTYQLRDYIDKTNPSYTSLKMNTDLLPLDLDERTIEKMDTEEEDNANK